MDAVSMQRRQLMIAGLAGLAVPAAFAGPFTGARDGGAAGVMAIGAGEKLVVSGRTVGPDGRALAGAVVEMWHAGVGGERMSATTDGDGRFVVSTVSRGSGRLYYRVRHAGHATPVMPVDFALPAGDHVAQLRRDEAGVWRAAFGVTLA